MFFFLTLFVQNVWGYDALRTGVSYLPMVAMILVASAAASQLVSRTGGLPLMIAGSVMPPAGRSGCPGSPSTATTPLTCSGR